jgi:hypothetical protein
MLTVSTMFGRGRLGLVLWGWLTTAADNRVQHTADTCFDIMWRRHTGQWQLIYPAISLDEALRSIETDMFLQPHV